MKYTHVLWDFNGTILDDVEAGIVSLNKLLGDRGIPLVSDIDAYRADFMFPVIDYYKKIGFDLNDEKYEDVAIEWMEQYLINSKKAKAVNGVGEAIAALGDGVVQVVISASESKLLVAQLKQLGLYGGFADILGTDNINAYGKTGIAAGWRKMHPDAVAVFVGDTVHDFEVACAINADCILFSGGHQSKDRLEKCGCPVIDNMKELSSLIN